MHVYAVEVDGIEAISARRGRTVRVRRTLALVVAFVVLGCTTSLVGCTTSLELGERRYREGDRLAALGIWRRIPPDGLQYEAAQQRIAAVEGEFRQLVVRYRQRAKYFERKDRLAEAVLSWRLASKLAPDEGDALARAQELSRELATRKRSGLTALRATLDRGDLAAAAPQLDALRSLDPFDPGDGRVRLMAHCVSRSNIGSRRPSQLPAR